MEEREWRVMEFREEAGESNTKSDYSVRELLGHLKQTAFGGRVASA